MKRVLDKTLLVYMLLGLINYLFCSCIMLIVYNKTYATEELSFLVYYLLSSVISLLLNRFVTFRDQHPKTTWPIRFLLVVFTCYMAAQIGFKAALDAFFLRPKIQAWLIHTTHTRQVKELESNISLLASSFAYCILNYFGQRYFVFRNAPEKKKNNA